MKNKIIKVNFGHSIAFYINGKLEAYKDGQFRYEEAYKYLQSILHLEFEPVKNIFISDESVYWENENNVCNNVFPDLKLDDLIKKLDSSVDMLFVD